MWRQLACGTMTINMFYIYYNTLFISLFHTTFNFKVYCLLTQKVNKDIDTLWFREQTNSSYLCYQCVNRSVSNYLSTPAPWRWWPRPATPCPACTASPACACCAPPSGPRGRARGPRRCAAARTGSQARPAPTRPLSRGQLGANMIIHSGHFPYL